MSDEFLPQNIAPTELAQPESKYIELKTYYKTLTGECTTALRDICDLHSKHTKNAISQATNSTDVAVAGERKPLSNAALIQQLSDKIDKFQKLVAVHLLTFDNYSAAEGNNFNVNEEFQRSIDHVIQCIECDRETIFQKKEKIQVCLSNIEDQQNYNILGGILFAMNRRVDSLNFSIKQEIERFGAPQLPQGKVGSIALADIPNGIAVEGGKIPPKN